MCESVSLTCNAQQRIARLHCVVRAKVQLVRLHEQNVWYRSTRVSELSGTNLPNVSKMAGTDIPTATDIPTDPLAGHLASDLGFGPGFTMAGLVL
eukprot:788388-Rhodomonas_salina.7